MDGFDFLIVSGLLSSFEKNPIKNGKVWFESEPSPLTLKQAFKAITTLPSLDSVLPQLDAQEFDEVVTQLSEANFKIEKSSVLAALVSRFCKKRQWHRVDCLLILVRKISRTMRVFLDTLGKLEVVVAKLSEQNPDDVKGREFLAFLREKIAL